jgi:hypothetical protein
MKRVCKIITKGTIFLLIITVVAASIISILYHYNKIDTAQTLEIAALTTLVLITAWYSTQTATMAKEMKEQRYSESLPLLVPTVPPILSTDELPYESLQTGVGVKVMWCNVGKGVAINSRFSFWTAPISPRKATFFPPRESGTLEVGGKKEVYYSEILNDGQLHDISDSYQPRVEAEYLDIYERKVTTVQKFRIDEQNEKAFLAELYFTINGRRLGEEVTHHD